MSDNIEEKEADPDLLSPSVTLFSDLHHQDWCMSNIKMCLENESNRFINFLISQNRHSDLNGSKGKLWMMYVQFIVQLRGTARAIRKTCPCNEYPLKPHFYIVKLGYAGVYLFFLFLLQNIDCGYSLEPPG